MSDLPEPISRQDELLHNIADGTPNIDDLVPISRQEEYLKYIAVNNTTGGGGGSSVNIVQTTGTSTTNVMSQKAVSENTCFGYSSSDNGANNVTIGRDASSTGSSNISIGMNSTSNNTDHISDNSDDCISIGPWSSVSKMGGVALGSYSSCSNEKSVALGYGSETNEDYVVSVSPIGDQDMRRIVNVGDPINDQDVVTKSYLNSKILTLPVIEQGTWEPYLTVTNTLTGTPPTYELRYSDAFYVKIGPMCYISFDISATITSAGSGYARIRDLPFYAISTGGSDFQGLSLIETANLSEPCDTAHILDNSKSIDLKTNYGRERVTWKTGNVWVGFSGWYKIKDD